MEATDWAPEHSDALKEHLGRGMSFSKIAEAINAQFNTNYSRNATIGRARRMGLAGSERATTPTDLVPRMGGQHEVRSEPKAPARYLPKAAFEPVDQSKLRCVEIEPRHLSLIELERRDCRYPYGGDAEGEAITFCGHPRRPGSSYCAPHFLLSRNPDATLEHPASAIALKVIETA
jgi:GcrA cell cycle regulator